MSTQTSIPTAPFTLTPLPAPLSVPPGTERIRVDGPGHPCRRCLRDAAVGDEVYLLSYDPWLGDGPYRQAGPVFVHAGPCSYRPGSGLPEQLTERLLSVRGFDALHRMTGFRVVPGADLAEAAGQLFAEAEAAYLHVHNAGPGCFAVRIDRA